MEKKILIFIMLITSIVFFVGCNYNERIKRLQELEEGVSRPTTEAELQEAIKKYQRRVDDIMIAEGRVGIWYKILGSRYMEQKMYKKALKCFQSALDYYPENQNLFYQVGLAASLVAKNTLDFDGMNNNTGQQHYYSLAVSSYKRAIEIDPKYSKAIYSLSVLYVFELGIPKEAISILESVVEREKKPLKHMFLLARAYYLIGENEKAISMYQNIISLTGSKAQKEEAQSNIKFIEEHSLN